VITYEAVAARVAAVAHWVRRTLELVVVLLVVGGVSLGAGFGWLSDWTGPGLVIGLILGGIVLATAVAVVFFTLDVRRAEALPTVSRQELGDAARMVAGRAASSERAMAEAKGLRKLLRLGQGLWGLRSDIEVLAEGGLAPAVSLGKALVPARILPVAVVAALSPFLLSLGLIVLAVAAVTA
jgi:hypothetical protein